MKEKIIKCSVSELQKEGLRFSVDEVAKSLKISKKTIYKYFPTKEELAVAIYNSFYKDAINSVGLIAGGHTKQSAAESILTVYFRSHCMVREEIFNKYSLNESIRLPARHNHEKIRERVEALIGDSDKRAVMIIIDGAMQKLCESKDCAEKVIKKLAGLIC